MAGLFKRKQKEAGPKEAEPKKAAAEGLQTSKQPPPKKPFFKKKVKKEHRPPGRPPEATAEERAKAAAATGDKKALTDQKATARRAAREEKLAVRKAAREPKNAARKAAREEKIAARKAAREQKRTGKKPRPSTGREGKAAREARESRRAGKAGRGKGGARGSKMSPVGLDLGHSSITAVRLRHQTSGSVLLQAAVDVLPEGLIQEGEVRDVDALAAAIRSFWRTYKVKGRKVELGLANQKIVVRSLDFPVLEEKELRSAIEFQAQDYIPIPIDEAVFDYHILGRFKAEEGVEKQKVLVVAAQKQMVFQFIDAMKKARLQVAGIDLQAFAMLRSQVTRSFLDEGAPGGAAVAVANIASDVTNLVVDVAGEPQFTRIIAFGGDDFTRNVQEQAGVTFAEAEVLKAQVGLAPAGEPEPAQPPEPQGEGLLSEAETRIIPPPKNEPGPGPEGGADKKNEGGGGGSPFGPSGLLPPSEDENGQQRPQAAEGKTEGEDSGELWSSVERTLAEKEAIVRRALEITTDALADDIRRSLDYYMSQKNSVAVGRLLLGGGGAMLPNLDARLSQIFPFQVVMGDPLKRIVQNRSGLGDDELALLAPRLAISIGLALEDED